MTAMIRQLLIGLAVTVMIAMGAVASPAFAQVVPQTTVPVVPPPPAPPPPSMANPPVPKMDAPPPPVTKGQSRRSFHDRVTGCLMDSNAAMLDTTERSAYSRACATR